MERILIVDDDESMRKSIVYLSRNNRNYQFEEVDTGEIAYQLVNFWLDRIFTRAFSKILFMARLPERPLSFSFCFSISE